MLNLVHMKLEKRSFDKALQEYVTLNKRATAGLVEHTARKVVTGFSPRSKSAHKVKGLRQFMYEKRATARKIESEYRTRKAQGRGTLRPPFHAVSKKAQSIKYRSTAAAINWRKRRGSAWIQATMLYPHWRPRLMPQNKNYKPNPRKHQGAAPDTNVKIRTTGNKPYVLWTSKVPGFVGGKYKRQAMARALRDAKQDMRIYIKRKHKQIKMGR